MTASDDTYWARLGRTSRVGTALRLTPTYAWHLLVKPYRRDPPIGHSKSGSERLRGRHAGAALDLWVAGFLRAFGDMAGLRLKRQSGSLAIRYIRLMAAINKEFEHRLAVAKSLALPEILGNALVQRCYWEWEDYARRRRFPSDLVGFMNLPDFLDDYSQYVSVATRPGFEVDAKSQLESILLDSGGYLARLARLVAESRGAKADDAVLRSCFNLGVAAKFADDLADIRADHREGRYNLLSALLTAEPTEHKAFIQAEKDQAPLTIEWWRSRAPDSFAEFTREFLRYYRQLGSPEFERLCDLAMLRCFAGSSQQPTTRAARTVTEHPVDPWR